MKTHPRLIHPIKTDTVCVAVFPPVTPVRVIPVMLMNRIGIVVRKRKSVSSGKSGLHCLSQHLAVYEAKSAQNGPPWRLVAFGWTPSRAWHGPELLRREEVGAGTIVPGNLGWMRGLLSLRMPRGMQRAVGRLETGLGSASDAETTGSGSFRERERRLDH